MDELKRMLALVTDQDPQIRRYAISQLEALASGDEEDDVMDVLRGALDDPVPLVRHQANRTLAFFLNRSFTAPESDVTVAPSPVKGAAFEGVPLARLREAGLAVIRPLSERMQTFARGSDVEVAKRAIVALGKLALPNVLPILTEAIRNPHLAKVAAVALSRLEVSEALEPLLEAAVNPEVTIRQHAILELGRFGDQRVLKALIENSQHPNPVLRANVALALGDHPDREAALPVLLSLLTDREVWVVLDVLRMLGRFRDRRAVTAVIDLYRNCEDGHVQATTISTLGRIGNDVAVPLVAEALKSQSERIRANAVEALVELHLNPQELAGYLSPLLKDPSNRTRGNAVLALHAITPEPALVAIDKMLVAEDVWFRASAAYCLGRIGNAQSVSRLVRLLGEEREAEVLSPSIKALEGLTDARVLPPLLKLLDHPAVHIRSNAARVLGRFRDRELCAALCQKFLTEGDGSVRANLISSIGSLADSRELSFVVHALEKDPEARVQSNAMMVLAAKGGLTVLASVRPFISSTHSRLKANAVLVLFSHGEFEIIPSLLMMLDAAFPKQFFSAIYVVGEIGRTLRFLHLPQTNVHLLHSLKALFLNTSGVSPRALDSKPMPVKSLGGMLSAEERAERIISSLVSTPREQRGSLVETLLRDSENPIITCILHRYAPQEEVRPEYIKALVALAESEKDFAGPAIELANHHAKTRDAPTMARAYADAYERMLALLADQLATTKDLIAAGRHSEAFVSLKEMAQCLPLRADRNLRLGRLYLAFRMYAKAARHLFLAHVENPSDIEVSYDYAKACFQKGDLWLARALCQEILRTARDGSPILLNAKRMLAALKEQGVS